MTINTKMVFNSQTNFKETLVYKRLLCGHVEKEINIIWYSYRSIIGLVTYWILITSCSRWPHSNRFYTSVSSKFVCVLSTIFAFMVTYKYLEFSGVVSVLNDNKSQFKLSTKEITNSLLYKGIIKVIITCIIQTNDQFLLLSNLVLVDNSII